MSAALVSGEGVRLELPTAGVASRILAVAVDLAIQFGALLVLALLDAAVAGGGDSAAAQAVLIVEVVAVLAGYPIVLEWLNGGRTVGKICLGLRVVRDDGGPIGFRQALVRGLAGLVLERPGLLFPLTTLAGAVTVCASEREKRIGDMMAGTVVLDERAGGRDVLLPPPWVPVPLQPWVLALDLSRLDDTLALRLRQFVSRAHELTPGAQFALADDLARRTLAVVTPPPPPGVPPAVIVAAVLAERRRRAPVASVPIRPAQGPPSAFAPPG